MNTLHRFIWAALLLAFLIHIHPCKAGRVLREQVLLNKQMRLQALQKGPVTPPGGSGCTHIPEGGKMSCPVKEMNVAGDVLNRSAAYPPPMLNHK